MWLGARHRHEQLSMLGIIPLATRRLEFSMPRGAGSADGKKA